MVGVKILRRALEEPFRQIVRNAGMESSIVLQNVRDKKKDYGYDARNNKYTNMFEAGIIDPTKVARVALENAASIAGLLLTTEVAISEIPEKDPPMPPMPPGGGDMGGMGGMY
jgi:chaperonin GroEL